MFGVHSTLLSSSMIDQCSNLYHVIPEVYFWNSRRFLLLSEVNQSTQELEYATSWKQNNRLRIH